MLQQKKGTTSSCNSKLHTSYNISDEKKNDIHINKSKQSIDELPIRL